MPETNLTGHNILIWIKYRNDAINLVTGVNYYNLKFALSRFGTQEIKGSLGAQYNGSYIGAITPGNNLDINLGSTKQSNFVMPDFSIVITRNTIDNSSGSSSDVIKTIVAYNFLRDLTFQAFRISADKPTPDPNAVSGNLIFEGTIQEGGCTYDPYKIHIKAESRVKTEDRPILRETFTYDEYPRLASDKEGEPIGLVFGDWSDRGSRYRIPAPIIIINTANDRLGGIVVARSTDGLKEAPVSCKWVDSSNRQKGDYNGVLAIADYGAASTRFRITDTKTEDYKALLAAGIQAGDDTSNWTWTDGDKIFLRSLKGLEGPTGDLIDEPSETIQFLLKDENVGLDLTNSDIDTFSIAKVSVVFNSLGIKCRAYIDSQASVMQTIQRICFEFLCKIVIVNNLYRLVYTGWHENQSPDHIITEEQIRKVGWSIGGDTTHEGYQGVQLKYDYSPRDGETKKEFKTYSDDDIPDNQIHKIDSEWIGDELSAINVASLSRLSRGGSLRTVKLPLDFTGLDIEGGDIVYIKTPEDIKGTYQAMKVRRNYDAATADITLIFQNTPGAVGVWSGDPGEIPDEEIYPFLDGVAAPPAAVWNTWSDEQKAIYSAWVDSDDFNQDGVALAKVWLG